jgi:hypothetical protein
MTGCNDRHLRNLPSPLPDPRKPSDVRCRLGERQNSGIPVKSPDEEEGRSNDEAFMRFALEQARIGKETAGGGEVGCVIALDGRAVPLATTRLR